MRLPPAHGRTRSASRATACAIGTSPTGRSWTSPNPHSAPAYAQPAPAKIFGEFTGRSPCELREDLAGHDGGGDDHHEVDDPTGLELHAQDTEPTDDTDRTGEQHQHTDTRWDLELDNPYLWMR